MNEAETRAELIDKQLEAAGWITGGDARVYRELPIKPGQISVSGARKKPLKADYVLAYKNVKLAAIEAKSNEKAVGEGVAQAKLYAEALNLPFSFAANGEKIYQINHRNGKEGEVAAFPSPEELLRLAREADGEQPGDDAAAGWLERFNAEPFKNVVGKDIRYYQEIAVNRVMDAIARDKPRILLTLATGTGKTHIAFQIVWKLFHSRWTRQKDMRRRPRVLFLTDRNILAGQAYLAFDAFGEARARVRPQDVAKGEGVPTNANIFFTIFQTLMSGEGKPYYTQYAPDFFDLVIIDECHRGGANDESEWRRILDHFSGATHLGLTATPKRKDNANTYKYFSKPVFVYSLKDGIEDGFLTPFRVKRIKSTIDEYVYKPGDKVLQGEVDKNRVYVEEAFNVSIEIEERERLRVCALLRAINPNEKTLVFCRSQRHAALVRDLINAESDSENVHYCARVTSEDGEIGEEHLRQFQDNEKTIPTILTTSQKLSTGVDARDVRNIAILRHINSMIEFKQIIGRGTRLFDGKYYFTIIDFVGASKLFEDAQWDGAPIEEEDDDDGGDTGGGGGGGGKPGEFIRVELGERRALELKTTTETGFFIGGKIVNAEEYLKHLFSNTQVPALLADEARLRATWAHPETRAELIKQLAEAGCDKEALEKLQKMIGAENSDLFDVLEYIAHEKKPVSRLARVEAARDDIIRLFSGEQLEFVGYILDNYIKSGADELEIGGLSNTLEAKYGTIHEAREHLGDSEAIRGLFIGLQERLYKDIA